MHDDPYGCHACPRIIAGNTTMLGNTRDEGYRCSPVETVGGARRLSLTVRGNWRAARVRAVEKEVPRRIFFTDSVRGKPNRLVAYQAASLLGSDSALALADALYKRLHSCWATLPSRKG